MIVSNIPFNMTIAYLATPHENNEKKINNLTMNISQIRSKESTIVADRSANKTLSITAGHLRTWTDMTPSERQSAGGMAGYAKRHLLNLQSWFRSARADGTLKPTGQAILDRAAGKTTLPQTAGHLRAWTAMTPSERRSAGNRAGYAMRHRLSIQLWFRSVRADGTLKPPGQAILDRAAGKTTLPLTAGHLRVWADMTPSERQSAGGMAGYARMHRLNIYSWINSARADGTLKPTGQAILDRAAGKTTLPQTAGHLRAWTAMTPSERQSAGGMAGYARMHRLNIYSWINSARADGTIRPPGQVILDRDTGKRASPITAGHLQV